MMQARVKEMEADQETIRAVRESIKNLDESLRALIQKSLAAQNDIQASTNQARTRILA
jgi:flagellar motility protein MotE (MotC chaperone)